MKTAVGYLAGILAAVCLIIVILITSVQTVCYWIPGYFEHEYTKHGVLETVHMEMDDLMDVTEDMMAYLHGDREELQVTAVVSGRKRPFFNDREIAHMDDVQGLFLGGMRLRWICLGLAALAVILLWRLRQLRLLPKTFCIGTGVFFGIVCLLAALIASDFNKYFTIFHEIFFDNDLWILNPKTDLLVNIVPEGFFMDTAAAIGGIFTACVVILFSISFFAARKRKNRPEADR